MPFLRLASWSQPSNKDFTLLTYPSFSLSVSCKNFNLDSLILYSEERLLISLSYFFTLFSASSFLLIIASNCFAASFLLLSIS